MVYQFSDVNHVNLVNISPQNLCFLIKSNVSVRKMSEVESVTLTISEAEVKSVSEVAQRIVNEIERFARKHGVEDQFDKRQLLEDLYVFLVERHVVGLEELRVSILEDGSITADNVIKGRRVADLIFKIAYREGVYSR